MAFNFGQMLQSMGHNFMGHARGGGSGAPVMNGEGQDISSAFGPQAQQGGGASDFLAKMGQALGGGQQPQGDKFIPPSQSGLETLLSGLAGQGGQALSAGGLQHRGYAVDPNAPVLPQRRGFGFRSV